MKTFLRNITLLAVFICSSVAAQDVQFSQFYSNPLYLGPSFAGAIEGSRIATTYRKQWWDLALPFNAYSVSYDHYFSTFNSGIGVFFMKDVAGSSELGSTTVSLNYSYNFQVFNVWYIRPGISFSYLEHGLNGRLLLFSSLGSEEANTDDTNYLNSLGQGLETTRDIDAGTSMLVYTERFWIGATYDHLLEPNVSLYAGNTQIPKKFQAYGGFEFHRRGKLLKPSDETMTIAFLYKNQATAQQLDLGMYWYGGGGNTPFILGLWYRGIPLVNSQFGDAMVFLAGIKTRSFNIGYSYDFTISSLLPYTKGSHEISMAYKFLLPKKYKRGAVPCPEF